MVAGPTTTPTARLPQTPVGAQATQIKAGVFVKTALPPGKPARVIPEDKVVPLKSTVGSGDGSGQLEILDITPGPLGHTKVRKGRSVYTVRTIDIEAIRKRKWMVHEVPVAPTAVPTQQLPPVAPVKTKEQPMDLGAITGAIGDLANIYTTVKSAGTPQYQPTWNPAGEIIDFLTPEQEAQITGINRRMKRRRRRRRLATVGDIKDLAALKSVLGNGEAFKTWIATHSR